jgi:hypothetical protein
MPGKDSQRRSPEVSIWEVIAIAYVGQLGTDPTDGNLLSPPSGGSRAEKHGQES